MPHTPLPCIDGLLEETDKAIRTLARDPDGVTTVAELGDNLSRLEVLIGTHGHALALHRKQGKRLTGLRRAIAPTRELETVRRRLTTLPRLSPDQQPAADWLATRLDVELGEQRAWLQRELPRRWKRTSGRLRRALAKGRKQQDESPSPVATPATRRLLADLTLALSRTTGPDDPHLDHARQHGERLAILLGPAGEAAAGGALQSIRDGLAHGHELERLTRHFRRLLPALCAEQTRARLDAVLAGEPRPPAEGELTTALLALAERVHARRREQFDDEIAPFIGAHAGTRLDAMATTLAEGELP